VGRRLIISLRLSRLDALRFFRQLANSQASADLLSRFKHPTHVTLAEAIARQNLTKPRW
jgi:hypothetical protein